MESNMNQNILTDNTNVYYAVKVNGMIVTQKFTSAQMAEQAKEQLSAEAKMLAEVVTVTSAGQELLLG